MNEKEKNSKIAERALTNPALTKAYDQVLLNWFPANNQRVAEVLRKLSTNAKLEDVVTELRTDPAMFTYCLRELSQQAQRENEIITDPVKLFKTINNSTVKEIIKAACEINTFTKGDLDEAQLLRVEETEISAETTLVLSEELKLDAGLGYSIAFFRQLGISLISWNFPEKYLKALERVKKDGFSLDDALTVELGFSARLLGQHIIDDWGMSDEILQSLRSSPHHLDMTQMGSFAEIITRVCEIGEVIAQVKNDHFYPKARQAWDKAENDLTKKFGVERKQLLEAKLDQRIREVRTPGRRPTVVPIESPVFKVPSFPAGELFHQNRYVNQCSQIVQDKLLEIYKDLEPGKLSLAAGRALCNDVIPSLGFDNGALYIFEPERLKLIPRFRVGGKALEQFKPVHCQYDLHESPVARAFQAGFPSLGQDEKGTHFITGTVGRQKKAGVLFLEFTEKIESMTEQDIMVIFKALLQTLSDCFNV